MNYRIYDRLDRYRTADKNFHMPGHKGAAEFLNKFPVADIDITELSYSDNLFCPADVIGAAQRDIAQIVGAKECFILTDGSTSGVLSMLYAARSRGNKLIVPRNSHQSVWNGCKLLGIEPVVLRGSITDGVMLPPSPEDVERALCADGDICGMLAVSPDYYGNIAPLAEYSRILKRRKKLLLVDGAHGAHLAFAPQRRGYAGVYADIWIDGAHKTLPTLTQGAAVLLNDITLLPALIEGLGIFRTSSPSYPVMASVEFGYKYMSGNLRLFKKLESEIAALKDGLPIKFYPAGDFFKLAADFGGAGISSDIAAAELEKDGIYAELSDGRYLLFYLSAMTGGLGALRHSIQKITSDPRFADTYEERPVAYCESNTGYLAAVAAEKELVDLKEAAGRVCAVNAGITPPCVPVAVAGDIITERAAEALQTQKSTFGLTGGKITVVKK